MSSYVDHSKIIFLFSWLLSRPTVPNGKQKKTRRNVRAKSVRGNIRAGQRLASRGSTPGNETPFLKHKWAVKKILVKLCTG